MSSEHSFSSAASASSASAAAAASSSWTLFFDIETDIFENKNFYEAEAELESSDIDVKRNKFVPLSLLYRSL